MSPEQCRGTEVDKASDQYALGTVVYAMLTGAPPFTGPSYQVLMAHNTQEPPPLLDTRPDCPTDLAEALERMLKKVPAERWPDIGKALRACGATVERPSRAGRDRRARTNGHVSSGARSHARRVHCAGTFGPGSEDPDLAQDRGPTPGHRAW